MNFKNWLLNEMPISKFQLAGQWEPEAKRAYGYNKQDIGILTNPKAVEKIHKIWSNTEYDFDFYFLRSKQAYLQREIGEVTPEWVEKNLGVDIKPESEKITIIFTNNTGTEKIPMTAWAIAHRLGHAIRRDKIFSEYFMNEITKDFRSILKDVYKINKGSRYTLGREDEKELRALAYAVGTMKSTRQENLVNFFEFVYELVAQWITTGRIKFNPLPRNLIISKKMAWGKPNYDSKNSYMNDEEHQEWNEVLQGYADKYEHYLNSVFMGLVGKMYVM
jgi:hypothetical protein